MAASLELSLNEGTPEGMRLGYVALVDIKSDTTILRRLLSACDWVRVRAAERRIEILQREHPTEEEATLPLTEDDVTFAKGTHIAIAEALAVLRPHMG